MQNQQQQHKTRTAAAATAAAALLALFALLAAVFPTPALAAQASAARTFKDVDQNAWYAADVQWVYQNGIMTGYGSATNTSGTSDTFATKTQTRTRTFGVGNNLTRAEFATLLAKASGVSLSATRDTTGIADLKTPQWYTAACNWAVKNGYITGCTQGRTVRFCPNDPVTREQAITILYRYLGASATADQRNARILNIYPDGKNVSAWARAAAVWGIWEDIMVGVDHPYTYSTGWQKPLTYIDATAPLTREQAAKVIHRALTLDTTVHNSTYSTPLCTVDLTKLPKSVNFEYVAGETSESDNFGEQLIANIGHNRLFNMIECSGRPVEGDFDVGTVFWLANNNRFTTVTLYLANWEHVMPEVSGQPPYTMQELVDTGIVAPASKFARNAPASLTGWWRSWGEAQTNWYHIVGNKIYAYGQGLDDNGPTDTWTYRSANTIYVSRFTKKMTSNMQPGAGYVISRAGNDSVYICYDSAPDVLYCHWNIDLSGFSGSGSYDRVATDEISPTLKALAAQSELGQ